MPVGKITRRRTRTAPGNGHRLLLGHDWSNSVRPVPHPGFLRDANEVGLEEKACGCGRNGRASARPRRRSRRRGGFPPSFPAPPPPPRAPPPPTLTPPTQPHRLPPPPPTHH